MNLRWTSLNKKETVGAEYSINRFLRQKGGLGCVCIQGYPQDGGRFQPYTKAKIKLTFNSYEK